jgi:small subunit ribosomal protein S2
MSNVSLRDLLEAGVHFGHRTRLWNPKMRRYIYGERNGVHIIDLQKTAVSLIKASRFISSQVAQGKKMLFVGTKRSATEVVRDEALRCNMFYVNNRWLGGTLTNYRTIKDSIDRLVRMERERDDGRLETRNKKERLDHARKVAKMERSLGGIKQMKGLPGLLFVVDPRREHNAIKEANKLKIPVVALCDTNCDPQGIDYVIPGNDDAIKSILLFTSTVADAVVEGQSMARDVARGDVSKAAHSEDVEIIHR